VARNTPMRAAIPPRYMAASPRVAMRFRSKSIARSIWTRQDHQEAVVESVRARLMRAMQGLMLFPLSSSPSRLLAEAAE